MTSATPEHQEPADTGAAPGVVATATPGPLVAGGLLLIAGIALLWQAVRTGIDNGVTLGGPTLAPIIVTGLWVAVASGYLLGQVRKRTRPAEPVEPVTANWRTPVLLLVAIAGYAIVLKYTVVGYVLSTAAFVLLAARLLGTRPLREVIVRDVVTAIALALTIYLVFTRLLGISLPAGVLPL
ncbi:tripartite tricarboxylate transporter TctB family protein [Dactylosporangium sp. AC04546]|uniref:tripartite tricarboxylate transporter TctB family protein n=1 Tax=Dactylosporangium sp. AC04546 TaxID=2862460 RepID=UPI001EDE088A|nr:tripartite tricarboxylate transporter TctB family protein [Dactylosporangium sp. AC04546]WVK88735.1 tripartite tricarboxylate transporter TctB family protein [Dactylosporangium sp. AC04546]